MRSEVSAETRLSEELGTNTTVADVYGRTVGRQFLGGQSVGLNLGLGPLANTFGMVNVVEAMLLAVCSGDEDGIALNPRGKGGLDLGGRRHRHNGGRIHNGGGGHNGRRGHNGGRRTVFRVSVFRRTARTTLGGRW